MKQINSASGAMRDGNDGKDQTKPPGTPFDRSKATAELYKDLIETINKIAGYELVRWDDQK